MKSKDRLQTLATLTRWNTHGTRFRNAGKRLNPSWMLWRRISASKNQTFITL